MDLKVECRKFYADILRNGGYVLSTPFCIHILKLLMAKLDLNSLLTLRFFVDIVLLVLGLTCIGRSLEIMEGQ